MEFATTSKLPFILIIRFCPYTYPAVIILPLSSAMIKIQAITIRQLWNLFMLIKTNPLKSSQDWQADISDLFSFYTPSSSIKIGKLISVISFLFILHLLPSNSHDQIKLWKFSPQHWVDLFSIPSDLNNNYLPGIVILYTWNILWFILCERGFKSNLFSCR